MFKKIIFTLLGIILIGSISSAGCIDLNFTDADVCIDIEQVDSNTFKVITDITDTNGTIAIACHLQLPDGVLVNVSADDCNDTFDYDEDDVGKVAGYISVNNERLTFKEFYDFDDGERDNISGDGDLDDFEFNGDTTPSDDTRETITITAIDDEGDEIDYDDEVLMTVEIYDSGRELADEDDFEIDGISFREQDGEDDVDFDNGELEFDIMFFQNEEYRITIEDEGENIDNDEDYDVSGSSNNDGDLDDFKFDGDTTPSDDTRETITITAIDDEDSEIDYDDEVLMTVEIYDSGRELADENDFEIDGISFREQDGEDDVDFDNGELEFDIMFFQNEEYRITIEDEGENIDNNEDYDVGGSSSNDGDLDEFKFYYIEDKTPNNGEWVTIKIEALDNNDSFDYEEEVTLTFERDGDYAEDNDIAIRSQDFDEEEDMLDNGEIKVYFINGELEFEVWFDHEDEYTITIEDEGENIEESQDFDVDNNNNNNNNSSYSDGEIYDFQFDADFSPNKGSEKTVTITAIDNNRDKIDNYDDEVLITIEMYDGGSWDNVDDDDFDIDIDSYFDEDDGEDDSDFEDGELEFQITFLKDRNYRITIEDEYEDIENYRYFRLDDTSDSDLIDNFDFDADFTPEVEEPITVKVEAFDYRYERISDYNKITLMTVEIYDDGDWDKADERDFEIDITFNEDDGEDEVTFDNGKLEFEIEFKEEGLFRIIILDEDENVKTSQEFDTGGQNYGENEFKVNADPDLAETNEWIDIQIEAVDNDRDTIEDYDNDIIFEVRYKYDTSDTRRQTTSSYYFEINKDNDRDEDYDNGIDFDRDRDGEHEFKDFIRFKKENYEYRLIVKEEDDTRMYGYDVIEIDGEGSSSSEDIDRFEVTITPDEIQTDSPVDVTVEALDRDGDRVSDYDNDIIFTIEYRTSSSSSRRDANEDNYSIANTDSRYRNYDKNGIEFDKDRNGRYRFNDFIEFDEEYEYRIIVEDVDDDSIDGEGEIDVDDKYDNNDNNDDDYDNTDGFDNDEFETVEKFYTSRPTLIDRLQDQYYKLKYSNSWNELSDEIYEDMKDVIENKSSREYDSYENFISAIWDRYYLTVSLR